MKLRNALDKLVDEPNFSLWQKVWIAEAAGTIRPGRKSRRHYDWLEACVVDADPALAATAASALGRLRRGDVDALKKALDRVGPAWRSLVFWGLTRSDYTSASSAAEDRFEVILLEEMAP